MTDGHKFSHRAKVNEFIKIISPQHISQSGIVKLFVDECWNIGVSEYRAVTHQTRRYQANVYDRSVKFGTKESIRGNEYTLISHQDTPDSDAI